MNKIISGIFLKLRPVLDYVYNKISRGTPDYLLFGRLPPPAHTLQRWNPHRPCLYVWLTVQNNSCPTETHVLSLQPYRVFHNIAAYRFLASPEDNSKSHIAFESQARNFETIFRYINTYSLVSRLTTINFRVLTLEFRSEIVLVVTAFNGLGIVSNSLHLI